MTRVTVLIGAGALFTGCTTTTALPSGSVSVNGGITIDNVDLNCMLDPTDETTDEDERFIATAELNAPDQYADLATLCHIEAYSRIPILQWDTIRDDIPNLAEDVRFTSVDFQLDELTLTIDGQPGIPAETGVRAGQVLVAPSINFNSIEMSTSPQETVQTTVFSFDPKTTLSPDEVVFGMQYVFDGTEPADLAPIVTAEANAFTYPSEDGLVNFLNRAFDSDDETLYLATIAFADVPAPDLPDEPADISVRVRGELAYEGEVVVGFNPFSSDDE